MSKKKYDAIIILSHLMDSKGNLNNESSLRADRGYELYRNHDKSYIITCGWDYRDDSDIKISDAMSDYLNKKYNIPLEKIIKEPNSKDTVGDAVFTRRNIVEKNKFKDIAIVTSSYHLSRAKEIFKFVYGNNFNLSFFGCEIYFPQIIRIKELNSLRKFRETFSANNIGDIDKIYNELINNHKLYII